VAQVGLDNARDRYQRAMTMPWNWGPALGNHKTDAVKQAEADLQKEETFWKACVAHCEATKKK
jgi:hypothetical protein